jgi:alkanesulfonate monooxygenase SsuD/methylene tetrahydromethanopterin reductase-like flavin-dependent oxidoreductase (luciferase family)
MTSENNKLRFQVLILPNLPWDQLLRRFKRVEELGFDLAVTADTFVDFLNPPSPWFELWTVLAGVAESTSTIRIAPCVAQIPHRNPALFARQALTVDHISKGRLEIGLGLGLTQDPGYQMTGIPNWTNKERAARFKEYVEIVDSLLTKEVTSYNGRFYKINDAVMNPRSSQKPRPPITIAAMGPLMIKYAAEYADTWNTMSFAEEFSEQLDETEARISKVAEHCTAIGRNIDTLRFSYNMYDARSRSGGGRIAYYESTETFAEMARNLISLGIMELGLYYPMLDEQLPVFETIAQETIPALRKEVESR